MAMVPLVERHVIDHVIGGNHSSLRVWLILLLVLAAAAFGFAFTRRYLGGRLALAVQYDLRNEMHDHLQTMDFANLDAMPTGQLVGRANSDSTLVQGLLSLMPIMSGDVLMLMLSLVVMFFLSPLLAVVSLVVGPALLVVSYRMRWQIFPATWDGQQREGDVVQIVDEDVNGVRVVKAFGQEQRELERVTDAAKVLYGSQMRAVRIQARYQPLLQSIPALGQVAILALGGWLALRHEITLGTFLAFSTYIGQLVSPVRRLAGVLTIGQQARAGLERIFQLLDLRPSIDDAPDALELPRLRGDISFRDVSAGYGDGEPVLNDFNLEIAAGERVALIGASGSGKSTATLLVSRFYDPTSGAVLVDGHDVTAVTRQSLRTPDRRRLRRELPVLRLGARQHRLWPAGRQRRRRRGCSAGRTGARLHHRAAPRLRHHSGGAGPESVRRPAAARRPRPRAPARPTDPDPRRRDQRGRRVDGGVDPHRSADGAAGPDRAARGTSTVDPAPCRPHRPARRGPRRRPGHP